MLREREGKEVEIPLFFNQLRLCNDLRVISRLKLCPQFIFPLNYENDLKIWNSEIIFTKKS